MHKIYEGSQTTLPSFNHISQSDNAHMHIHWHSKFFCSRVSFLFILRVAYITLCNEIYKFSCFLARDNCLTQQRFQEFSHMNKWKSSVGIFRLSLERFFFFKFRHSWILQRIKNSNQFNPFFLTTRQRRRRSEKGIYGKGLCKISCNHSLCLAILHLHSIKI